MRRDFYLDPQMNKLSQEQIRRFQEKRLPDQLTYCYERSEFYRNRFDEAGARPADIRTIQDLRQAPRFYDQRG